MQRTWAVDKPIPPLLAIARQAGFSEAELQRLPDDQKMLDGLQGEQKRAAEKFEVEFDADPVRQRQEKVPASGPYDLAKVIDPLLKS